MVELLREIVVFGHIIGFAVTFGAWVAEAPHVASHSPR